MNFRNIISAALSAAVIFSCAAEAQEKSPTIVARAAKKAKEGADTKVGNINIVSSTKPGVYTYQKDADTTPEVNIEKNFSIFYALTPAELVEADSVALLVRGLLHDVQRAGEKHELDFEVELGARLALELILELLLRHQRRELRVAC